jgi:hypothetical protein
MSQRLVITLADNFELCFNIRQTPLAELWLERMHNRHVWPMDNPDRFYGFGTVQQEQDRAINMIQQCIVMINDHQRIIDREFEYTQDCLNYLHNIFERYHGLLDQQTSQYWQSAPESARQALVNLNLAVHRCETAVGASAPRLVCTWFGMPKTHQLDVDTMMRWGELEVKFGTVYMNYCEIGKTVEDLVQDNDIYIGNDAFKPFGHYSADFNVAFFAKNLETKIPRMQQYVDQHRDFFLARGIENVYNVQALPLRFPVADLLFKTDSDTILSQIRSRQSVSNVAII